MPESGSRESSTLEVPCFDASELYFSTGDLSMYHHPSSIQDGKTTSRSRFPSSESSEGQTCTPLANGRLCSAIRRIANTCPNLRDVVCSSQDKATTTRKMDPKKDILLKPPPTHGVTVTVQREQLISEAQPLLRGHSPFTSRVAAASSPSLSLDKELPDLPTSAYDDDPMPPAPMSNYPSSRRGSPGFTRDKPSQFQGSSIARSPHNNLNGINIGKWL
ncbi:hypothetical protein C8J57DRAFT_319364 [Mycena rebaudengoi]|nr:hypothetical protein C8J57DRAFT_319364 [Mycena rebaudengoi]